MNSSVYMNDVPVPYVVVRYISSFLDIKTISTLSKTNKHLRNALKSELEKRIRSLVMDNLIGPKSWNQISSLEIQESTPPEQMIQYLMTPCPFKGKDNKKTFQTHRAVYIPPNLTVNGLIQLSKKRWFDSAQDAGNSDAGYWIVMRRCSVSKKDLKEPYRIASILESITYFVMAHKFFPVENSRSLDFEPRAAEHAVDQRLFHIVFDRSSSGESWIRALSATEKLGIAVLQRF